MNDLEREKKQIRAILQSVKFGLSVGQLWKDYIKIIGTECDYRQYGFHSFQDFLAGIPDTVRFTKYKGDTMVVPVVTTETKHLSKMVANQKTQGGSNVSRRPSASKDKYDIKPVPLDLQGKLKRLMIPYPNGLPVNLFANVFAKKYGFNILPEKFGYTSMTDFISKGSQVLQIVPDETGVTQLIKVVENPTSFSISDLRPTVSARRKGRVASERSAIRSETTFSWKPTFGRSISETTDRSPHSREEKLSSSFGRQMSLNDIDTSPIVPAKPQLGRSKGSLADLDPIEEDNKPKVPESLKGILWRLLKQHPSGMPLQYLPHFYQRYAHEDFPVYALGFKSMEEMVASIPDVMMQQKSGSDVLVFAVQTSPTAEETLGNFEGVEPPLSSKVPAQVDCENPLPSPAYTKAEWPKNKTVNVIVTHVEDPGHFYVQIMEDKMRDELASLQEDLTMFYSDSTKSQNYYMTSIQEGQACIALYEEDRMWYRAEVLSVPEDHSVEVRYVDFGNTAIVSRTSVKRAKAHYLSLPMHAIECTAAKIKPKGSKIWSVAAIKFFKGATENNAMVAFVKSTVEFSQSSRLSLALCDTSTDDDIFINDEMIKRDFAVMESPKMKRAKGPAVSAAPAAVSSAVMGSAVSTHVTSVAGSNPYGGSVVYQPAPSPVPMGGQAYYQIPPQLWSSYMTQLTALQQQQQRPSLQPAYIMNQPQQYGSSLPPGRGYTAMPIPTPAPTPVPVFGMGFGMGTPIPAAAMPQPGPLYTPSSGRAPPTLGQSKSIGAVQSELSSLKEQRKQIIQEMSDLSRTSSGLGSSIDVLSTIETKIKALERDLTMLKAFQSIGSDQPTCQSAQQSVHPLSHQSVHPSSQQSVHPSSQQSVHSSSRQSVHPSSQQSVHPSSHQSVHPSSQQSVHPSSQLSVHPSSQQSVHLSSQQSVPPLSQQSVHPSSQQSVYTSSQESSQQLPHHLFHPTSQQSVHQATQQLAQQPVYQLPQQLSQQFAQQLAQQSVHQLPQQSAQQSAQQLAQQKQVDVTSGVSTADVKQLPATTSTPRSFSAVVSSNLGGSSRSAPRREDHREIVSHQSDGGGGDMGANYAGEDGDSGVDAGGRVLSSGETEQFLLSSPPLSPAQPKSLWETYSTPQPHVPGGVNREQMRNPAFGLGRGSTIASLFSQTGLDVI